MGENKKEKKRRKAKIIEMAAVAEIKVEQAVSRGKRQSVIAAVFFQGDKKVIEHLGKGQGDHDEMHAGRAQAERPDNQCRKSCREGRQRQGEQGIVAAGKKKWPGKQRFGGTAVEMQDSNGIGADSDKGSMAKTDHGAVAEQKIKACGGESINDDATGEGNQVRVAAKQGKRRQKNKKKGAASYGYLFSGH